VETPYSDDYIEFAAVGSVTAQSPHERAIRDNFDQAFGKLPALGNLTAEIVQSKWIEELRLVLRRSDEGASFLDRARHFIVPLQDDFAEVVAWNIRWEIL